MSEWRRFRRVGEVIARTRDHPWTWTTEAEELMYAEPGDWAVTDASGRERSVDPESFSASYELIEGDRYRRRGIFLARQAVTEETISTEEGDAVAHAGDWIVEGVRGEIWPVPAHQFETTYEELHRNDQSDCRDTGGR